MITSNILFDKAGRAIAPADIRGKIAHFRYTGAVHRVIQDSRDLDRNGEVFVRCAALVLSNFRMTRSGRFMGIEMAEDGSVNGRGKLLECWNEVGGHLVRIHDSVLESGYSRDRYLLELCEPKRRELTAEVWSVTKRLLPHTMGKTSYGLVGASKLLFAVLPEIVLPVDNSQWLHVFKTVDLGDILNRMVSEIQHWEEVTGKKLDELDASGRLTTLPAVYNVMAMAARPKPTTSD